MGSDAREDDADGLSAQESMTARKTTSVSGRTLSTSPGKTVAASTKRDTGEVIGLRQLKKADELLARIERKGEILSESAERLLKRVS
jgi:hypothetical protein